MHHCSEVCAKPGMIRLVMDLVIGTGQSIGLLGLVSKQLTTCSTTACPSFFRRRVALPSPLAKSSSSFCVFWSRTATVVALAVRLGAMASWEEGEGESNGDSPQTLCVPTPIPPHHPCTAICCHCRPLRTIDHDYPGILRTGAPSDRCCHYVASFASQHHVISKSANTHTRTHTSSDTCTHMHMHTHTCTYIYTHMHMHTHSTCAHTHVHTHTIAK